MNEYNIDADMRIALGIARFIAPIDTGNLRFNAISANRVEGGFQIKYSLQNAYYIYFLEEGTRKFQGHRAFIEGQTVPAIASFLSTKYEFNPKNTDMMNHFMKFAAQGNNDTIGNTLDRDKRFYNSFFKNVDEMASRENWQHNDNVSFYNNDFRGKKVTDFVEYLGGWEKCFMNY